MMEFYKVDVFAEEPLKGNPATVVLGTLKDELMHKLAFELNVTETVFVDENKLILRFFTPKMEVDLCGHATIGAFYVLRLRGLKNGRYEAITKAGKVKIEVGNKIWLKVVAPKIVDDRLKGLEGVVGKDILDSAIVDVGIRIGLAEVGDFETLMELKPNIEEFCRHNDIVGIHFYTFDSSYDGCVRFFAPTVGILEDPATGTANSALAFYLNSSGKLVKDRYVFEQGHALGREGKIHVRLDDGVWVGGDVICIARGIIDIDSERETSF